MASLEGFRTYHGEFDPDVGYKPIGQVELVSLFCQSCFSVITAQRVAISQDGRIIVFQSLTSPCCDTPKLVQITA